jgi:hypothetical protein
MKIYTTTPTKKTITGFIKALYNHEKGKYVLAVETFSDKECSIRECKPARRSFEDLVDIVTTRYPKVSEKRVANAVRRLCDVHGFKIHICSTIKKPVLLKYKEDLNWSIELYPTYNLSGEYEKEVYQANAKYKWKDIKNLMDI